jgi:hypothetical protein
MHFFGNITILNEKTNVSKKWGLRAAISMARLWRNQGKPQQVRELLGPIYSRFTKGSTRSI